MTVPAQDELGLETTGEEKEAHGSDAGDDDDDDDSLADEEKGTRRGARG